MKRIIIIIIMAVMAMHAIALDVAITAGGLKDKVSDKSISTLTVTGTINAEDFYFISDNLRQLTSLDLSGARVVPCRLAALRFMRDTFGADELPAGSLAGLFLTHLVLPDSLKVIGEGALAGCGSLTAVVLPSALEQIGDYAFAGCNALGGIVMPATLLTVGRGAFMRCTALESFTVEPSARLTTLGDCALMDCSALRTVGLGAALTTIGERAFAGTALSDLDLSACRNLSRIGDWAMVMTPVETAVMPNGLTHLGDGTFLYDTRLAYVNLGNKLADVNDYLLAGTVLDGSLVLPTVSTVGNYAFYNVSTLSSVQLPETLTFMGDRAMAGMTSLRSLESKAASVPGLGLEVWAGVNQSTVPLKVPMSARVRYQAADQWQEFLFQDYGVPGDVNGDGEVTVADINTLIDIIMNYGEGFDEDTMMRADVNMDGEVNVADINAVIAIVLS